MQLVFNTRFIKLCTVLSDQLLLGQLCNLCTVVLGQLCVTRSVNLYYGTWSVMYYLIGCVLYYLVSYVLQN